MFFDKYAMKNNLQNTMQITLFLMASKNINFDHMCPVIGTGKFLIRARDCDV